MLSPYPVKRLSTKTRQEIVISTISQKSDSNKTFESYVTEHKMFWYVNTQLHLCEWMCRNIAVFLAKVPGGVTPLISFFFLTSFTLGGRVLSFKMRK